MNNYIFGQEFIKLSKDERLYNIDCPIIGLTGGIATGKSTVTEILRKQGHHIICADELVKNIYKNIKTIEFIQKHYPQCVYNSIIDFKKLREIFFNDRNAKIEIEKLIYSQMPAAFKLAYSEFKSPNFIFYDVPLLFEKALDKLVDLKLLVYCPREVQIERVMMRDNIDKQLAIKIIDSQINIEDKRKQSDFVIENIGKKEEIKIPTNIWV